MNNMEIKQGMYVRTKDGELFQCLMISIDENNPSLNRFMNEWGNMIMFDEIDGEPSFDIAELVRVGDYVNGKPVVHKYYIKGDSIFLIKLFGGKCIHSSKHIESVVTKEMFNGCKYEVQHESTN